jgi:hypothetical protein
MQITVIGGIIICIHVAHLVKMHLNKGSAGLKLSHKKGNVYMASRTCVADVNIWQYLSMVRTACTAFDHQNSKQYRLSQAAQCVIKGTSQSELIETRVKVSVNAAENMRYNAGGDFGVFAASICSVRSGIITLEVCLGAWYSRTRPFMTG